MAVVPAVPPIVTGVLPTSTQSQIAQVESYLVAPPIAQLRQDTVQALGTSGTFFPITFDAEVVDSVGGHDNVTNNSRYTAVYAGWYEIDGGVAFAANATGSRFTEIAVNGSAVGGGVASAPATAGIGLWLPVRATLTFLNVGDYVEIWGRQDSGGALNTDVGTQSGKSSMTVIWRSN